MTMYFHRRTTYSDSSVIQDETFEADSIPTAKKRLRKTWNRQTYASGAAVEVRIELRQRRVLAISDGVLIASLTGHLGDNPSWRNH
jgi:hypothetical protein